jgi:predicted dehydrogenase
LKVGIVGCGLIGQKRAKALGAAHQLLAVADIDQKRAEKLAADYSGCVAFNDWRRVVDFPGVELIIVATTNDKLTPVSVGSVSQGKHVLVEKPAARNATELRQLVEVAAKNHCLVKVGFNHRFHPAFIKARQIWESGELGELMYIRARYGHGGRIGYEKEWRANPEIAGGGELLDQGVHLIDLSRWFAGEFSHVSGHVGTYYWNMPVEDNGFMLLKTAQQQVAWLHVSCSETRNIFSFEIFGRQGKLEIQGLGGSYGLEGLTYYQLLPELGPPMIISWQWPFEDKSWVAELNYFARCIEEGQPPEGNLQDALAALEIIQSLYELNSNKVR